MLLTFDVERNLVGGGVGCALFGHGGYGGVENVSDGLLRACVAVLIKP